FAPSSWNPVRRVGHGKAYEIRRERVALVWCRHRRHACHLAQEQREVRPAVLRLAQQKCALLFSGYPGGPEIPRREHRKLEVVVQHLVVLAHPLKVAEHLTRACENTVRSWSHRPTPQVLADQRAVLGRTFPDRLAAQRRPVAYLAVGRQLPA